MDKVQLGLQQEQGNQQGIIECVAGFAGVALDSGKPEIAAQLFRAAETLLHSLGAPLAPADQREWEQDVSQLRAWLAAEALARAWAAGRALAEGEIDKLAAAVVASAPSVEG